jgi:hypothetical protein
MSKTTTILTAILFMVSTAFPALQPPIPDSLLVPYQDSLHILVVPVHSNNLKLPCDIVDIKAMLDQSPNDSDVQALYEATSHGNVKLTFETVDTFTVNHTVDTTDTTSHNDSYAIRGLAKSYLTDSLGYTLTDYDRVVFFHALNSIWGGYATGNEAVLYDCDNMQTLAHEIGHTIGLYHAGGIPYTQDNAHYKDASNFMGGRGNPMSMLSAPHKLAMGWVDTSKILQGPLSSGTYEIAPLHLEPEQANYPQVIVIPSLYDTVGYYFLSYRLAEGWDAALQDKYKDKVNVHRMALGGSWRAPQSWFLGAAADNGGVLVDSREFYIRQTAHDAEKATFTLTMLTDVVERIIPKAINGHSLHISPNPAASQATIRLRGIQSGKASVSIYNLRGERIQTLWTQQGIVKWNGRDSKGNAVAAGTYLVQAKTPSKVFSQHLVILR